MSCLISSREKIQQNKTNKTWQQSRPNDVNSRSVRFSFFFLWGGGDPGFPFYEKHGQLTLLSRLLAWRDAHIN